MLPQLNHFPVILNGILQGIFALICVVLLLYDLIKYNDTILTSSLVSNNLKQKSSMSQICYNYN